MSKNKLEKPKKKTQVNGKPEFENGKLVKPQTVPYKKNGKVKNVDVKKVEKEMDKVKFARSDLTFQNTFIKKCLKEIAFTDIKEVGTSKENEKEKILCFRSKKIMQFAHSKVAYFTAYVFSPDGKQNIKVVDQNTADKVFDLVIEIVQSIEDKLEAKAKAKAEKAKSVVAKPKKAKPSKVETVDDVKARIENLSDKNNAIHITNISDDIKSYADAQGYKFVDDGHTLLVKAE